MDPAQLPPKLPRRQIPRVIAQLVMRMRWDLTVMVLLCSVSLALGQTPMFRGMRLIEGSGLSILGIAASIFVAFRNTQAINRWWEARVLWGTITNASRHWRDTLHALLGSQPELRGEEQRLVALQSLQAWLLNFELRGYWREDAHQAAHGLGASLGLPPQITLDQTLRVRAAAIGQLRHRTVISALGCDALLRSSETFTNALGGLQRIRNTPLPPTYDVFIRLICWLFGYALFLNFSSQGSTGTGAMLFLGYLVAERIGAYIEGPFDRDGSSFCVPMDLICSRISADLLGSQHPLGQVPVSRDPSAWS